MLLDSQKTALERNKLGQFATPPELALSLAQYAREILGKQRVRFIDPAIGTGSFFSAVAQTFPSSQIESALGIEVDPLFANAARNLWKGQNLQVLAGDFTVKHSESAFNLVLTNPPYVRHHHLPVSEKERLQIRLAESLQMKISGLAGLYCYFLLLCHDWMEADGLGIWLIPSEFMDVNYGAALREYLTERVTLLHIHRFCPTDVQFTDALVSSAVVVFRKSSPQPGQVAKFSFGGLINDPKVSAVVSLDRLRRSRKWTQYPDKVGETAPPETALGDIFTIKRGIATGSNNFFILTPEQIEEWQIPSEFLKPILPGPRFVKSDVIDALPDGTPSLSPHLFLLDCRESEENIRLKWPRFYEYLQSGHEGKVSSGYLVSRKKPWYSQEGRPAAPFLCTYMGRTRKGGSPFRFLWNRSVATAHNVYLMLYPRGPLARALHDDPRLYERVFAALQQVSPSEMLAEGRVYGGGLYKVEPNELAQVSASLILDSISHAVHFDRQERLFA